MSPPNPPEQNHWERVTDIFSEASLMNPDERTIYVQKCAGGDPDVLREVFELLKAFDDHPTFLEETVAPMVEQMVGLSRPLPSGQRLGDFEIIDQIGEGAFARVYRARQVSLGREVALKVSRGSGSEAQLLASLQHDSIVPVFAEFNDRDYYCIAMQLVDGVTAKECIDFLRQKPSDSASVGTTGADLLGFVEAKVRSAPVYDPKNAERRLALTSMNHTEFTCWFGLSVTSAIAHAHSQSVLHLDLKPANILVNYYGRPLVGDFNVSVSSLHGQVVGGTPKYMPPEQTLNGTVDERADVFALGTVIREFLCTRGDVQQVDEIAAQVRVEEDLGTLARSLRFHLAKILSRATERNLQRRLASARDLYAALQAFVDRMSIHHQLSRPNGLIRAVDRRPLIMTVMMLVAPHVIGSVVNIVYNGTQIISRLTEEQQFAFAKLVVGYNLLSYTGATIGILASVSPLFDYVRNQRWREHTDPQVMAALRRRTLLLPKRVFWISTVGWMPGALFFPFGIDVLTGHISAVIYAHFFVSFAISWLVATTYAYMFVQFVCLRFFFPLFLETSSDLRGQVEGEVRQCLPQKNLLPFLAGLIPMMGALLVVGVFPEEQGAISYRVLVTSLIGLGMIGLVFALNLAQQMGRMIYAYGRKG